jgi:hypothetical protein
MFKRLIGDRQLKPFSLGIKLQNRLTLIRQVNDV